MNLSLKKNIIWTIQFFLIALIFIVPIVINKQHFFPFTTIKSSLVIIFTSCIGIIYLFYNYLKSGEVYFPINTLTIVSLLYGIILGMSGLFGFNPVNSFFGSFGLGVGIIFIWFCIILGIITGWLVRKDNSFVYRLLSWSFLSGIIVALGTYYPALILNQEGSTMGNTSYAGAYLLIQIGFGFIIFNFYKNKIVKTIIFLGILTMIGSPLFLNPLLFSNEFLNIIKHPLNIIGSANGAFLGILLMIFFIGILSVYRFSTVVWKKRVSFILLITISFSVVIGWFYLLDPNSKIHNYYVQEKSGNRFIFWDIAKKSTQEYPVLGWGLNNYTFVYQKNFSPIFYIESNRVEMWTDSSHNIFFDHMVHVGYVGLFVYILLLISIFYNLLKIIKREEKNISFLGIVLFSILIGYLFQNLFVFDTVTTLLLFFVILGIVSGYSTDWEFKVSNYANKFISIFGITILFLSIYYVGLLPLKESKKWVTYTKTLLTLNNFESNNPQNISLVGNVTDISNVYTQIFNVLEKNILLENSNQRLQYIPLIDSIINNIQDNIQGQENGRIDWILGKYFNLKLKIYKNDQDSYEKAIYYLTKSNKINPGYPTIFTDIAQTYFLKGYYQQSYENMINAINLLPNYTPVYVYAYKIYELRPDKNFKEFLDIKMKENNIVLP